MDAKTKLWFGILLPLYILFMEAVVLYAATYKNGSLALIVVGSFLLVGNGLAAYRLATLIQDWKVRGFVLTKLILNIALSLRGAMWILAGIVENPPLNSGLPGLLDLGLTTLIFATVSGLGFLVWYDLKPVQSDDELALSEVSLLAGKIDLRPWKWGK